MVVSVNGYGLPRSVELCEETREVVARIAMRCACEHYFDPKIYRYDPDEPTPVALRVRFAR